MAKQPNPFDPTELMRLLDPSQALGEWRRLLESYGAPKSAELPAVMDAQRKNMEALLEANRLLMSSIQAVMQRQSELLNEATQEAAQAAAKLASARQPAEWQKQQMELIAAAYGRTVGLLQEVSGIINAAQKDALEVLNRRWNASIDELRTLGDQGANSGQGDR